MAHDADSLIAALSPAIDRKCAEITDARRERYRFRLFITLCVMVVLIPVVFVVLGFSLLVLLIPVIFIAVAVLALSPILINQQGGRNCEQI